MVLVDKEDEITCSIWWLDKQPVIFLDTSSSPTKTVDIQRRSKGSNEKKTISVPEGLNN